VTVGGTRVAVGSRVDVLVGGTRVAVGSGVGVTVGGTRVAVGSRVGVTVGGKGVGLGEPAGAKLGRDVTNCATKNANSETIAIINAKSRNALFSTVIFSFTHIIRLSGGTKCSNKRWYRVRDRSCLPASLVTARPRV